MLIPDRVGHSKIQDQSSNALDLPVKPQTPLVNAHAFGERERNGEDCPDCFATFYGDRAAVCLNERLCKPETEVSAMSLFSYSIRCKYPARDFRITRPRI